MEMSRVVTSGEKGGGGRLFFFFCPGHGSENPESKPLGNQGIPKEAGFNCSKFC